MFASTTRVGLIQALAALDPMRLLTVIGLTILLICTSTSCSTLSSSHQADRALFVGNSLTYVGNLPAVFSALAKANGKPIASDMIVKGGATLSQRVSDGSVARALDENDYSTLVLQERGGDLLCSFGPDSCVNSRQAIKALAALARNKGVQVVLLGTYQPDPGASQRLVKEESSAAAEAGIPYIEVSETLQKLRRKAPDLTWFAPDGTHPGKDLALLSAVLIYKELLDSAPKSKALNVKAPIYGSTSGLKETLRQADAPPPLPETQSEISYSRSTLIRLLSARSTKDGS